MSVTSAIVAPTVKVPANNSLVIHLRWYPQQLQKGIPRLTWADTRDRIADGRDQGLSVEKALEKAMEGIIAFGGWGRRGSRGLGRLSVCCSGWPASGWRTQE